MIVLYQNGAMGIESHLIPNGKVGAFCRGSRVAYTSHSVESYRASKPGKKLELITLEEACKRIEPIKRFNYCKPWERTTKSKFNEMLEVLFPLDWGTVDGVEIFSMSEMLTGNITAHYAEYEGRYYYANREIGSNGYFGELAKEVKAKDEKYV